METSSNCTLITGATSGIGSAIAVKLSASRRLILSGRDLDRLETIRLSCHNPEKHLIWNYNLIEAEGVAAGVHDFLRQSGVVIDNFVHCAGVAGLLPARSADFSEVQAKLYVNFISAQQIVAILSKRKVNKGALRGVVAISSVASRFGVKGYSLYCSAKAALDGWMRALAVELAPLVRVNSVLPGAVLTSTTEKALSEPSFNERISKDYPLGVGTPNDIADVVEFLLSEKSRWITGQEIIVDGGFSINGTA